MSSSARNRSGRSAGASPSAALQMQGRFVSLATCHGKERALGLEIHEQLLARRTNFTHCRVGAGRATGETDMRAHLNPTRMAAIRALAFRLVRRIARSCPGAMASRRPILGTVCPAIPEPALGLGASPEPTQSVAQALSSSPAPQPLSQAIKPISRANRSPSQAGWGRS